MFHRLRNLATPLLALGLLLTGCASPPAVSRVVVTGRTLSVNGHTQVPRGLFGVHWTDLDPRLIEDWGIECVRHIYPAPAGGPTAAATQPEWQGVGMVIDCLGDRYHPATVLTDPKYEDYFTRLGRSYAAECARLNWPGWVEFWNEPFLNWASRPGVNYDPKFYDLSQAGEGRPMTIKGRGEPCMYLAWTTAVRTVHAEDGSTDLYAYLAYAYIGRALPAGTEFEFRGRRYRNVETWWGRDVTQTSYFSGKQNAQFYHAMLVPFAKAVKETNPRVQVIAGWGMPVRGGDWEAWRNLYKATIDHAVNYLDGIDEHHYETDTRLTAAEYEVITSYAMSRYGKWLYGYNTECGGTADTQIPGADWVGDATVDPLARALGACVYGLRDIIYLVQHCPDKAMSRATHGANKLGWGLGGDEFVFRMLKDLRGQLVEARSDDESVWCTSSINPGPGSAGAGTADARLTVVLFNDHAEERQVDLLIQAPTGTTLSAGTRSWVEVDTKAWELALRTAPVPVADNQVQLRQAMPGRSALTLVFPLRGAVPAEAQVRRRQFFADDVLRPVRGGASVKLNVALDEPALWNAGAARLKLALSNVPARRATVQVNDRVILLPATVGITEIPLDPTLLGADNALVFRLLAPATDSYMVEMASIVLETVPERVAEKP